MTEKAPKGPAKARIFEEVPPRQMAIWVGRPINTVKRWYRTGRINPDDMMLIREQSGYPLEDIVPPMSS